MVSIIIPARNEAENIGKCMGDIMQQNYPLELMEIIIVDDNSTDTTYNEALEFKNMHKNVNVKILSLKDNAAVNSYKKAAITTGIMEASGTLIITTDADCRYPNEWVKTIVEYQLETNVVFISSPVCFIMEQTSFEKMQTLEFISLIGIGGAALNMGWPIVCNGANISFLKEAFMAVGGYNDNEAIASGDDVYLMLKMARKYPSLIRFLKTLDATVYTYPKATLHEFYQQRKRWASKGTKYKDTKITMVAIITYLANLAWLINFILAIVFHTLMPLFLIITLARMIVEVAFLSAVSVFFNRSQILMLYLPTFLFNVLYVVIMGVAGSIGGYVWKGRTVK